MFCWWHTRTGMYFHNGGRAHSLSKGTIAIAIAKATVFPQIVSADTEPMSSCRHYLRADAIRGWILLGITYVHTRVNYN